MTRTTIARVNGQGKVNGQVSRKVLERNVMDRITWSMSFEDALDVVELATVEELKEMLMVETGDEADEIAMSILERA